MKSYTDVVICGPDMSGTSTQIEDFIEFFQLQGKTVKDMRGNEFDALFHAEIFKEYNKNHISLKEFLKNGCTDHRTGKNLVYEIADLLSGFSGGQDLKVASMVKNDITTYVNPDKADVWIFEEPTRRGAGQVCRVIENNRTKFGSETDHTSTAISHQVYRLAEFLKFRKPIREKGKIIIRSRSEESGCYQMYDQSLIKTGINDSNYLNLPGHQIAFANPPTHLFIVCGPKDWTVKEYLRLKEERSQGRITDDLEKNASYQVKVNERYATDWIYNFYKKGCEMHNTDIPKIYRFNIYHSKKEIKKQMTIKLRDIIKGK